VECASIYAQRKRSSCIPPGRRQPAFAVSGERDSGLIEILSIPTRAGDLAMALIERFAIIGIGAQTHLVATTQSHLAEPVRIGKRLAREADNVSVARREQPPRPAQSCVCRLRPRRASSATLMQAGAHVCRGREIAPEGALRIRVVGRHALIAALTGIRIGRLPTLGWLASSNFPPRDNEM
jgi:hypothetical protein